MTIDELYHLMLTTMGPQYWLEPGIAPAETPWEILWGGVLVQNTNWRNVDYALENLKQATQFEPQRLLELSSAELTTLVKPAGFYTRKVPTLQGLAQWSGHYEFDLARIRALPATQIRRELKALKGIGDETADYFTMYVFNKPTIIVDTYLRRLFSWLGLTLPSSYVKAQAMIAANWDCDFTMAREFHALIVEFGKQVKSAPAFQQSFLADQQLHLH